MSRLRVGITGQSGFVGSHLSHFLRTKSSDLELIPFSSQYFQDPDLLQEFVLKCDTIVHLAAMNRGDPGTVYENNMELVRRLLQALGKSSHTPHIIFASSIQENLRNPYGNSKREGRMLLEDWAKKSGAEYTALLIPNVFGPFGRPYYNSVVATFCYQLTHGKEPKIEHDAQMKLIYIHDLVEFIYSVILKEKAGPVIEVPPTRECRVSGILSRLLVFRDSYLEKNRIPELGSRFDTALFNTFRSYIEPDHFPRYPDRHDDARGSLFELVKTGTGGQIFFSVTNPGFTRGNHYHVRKIERFCVVQGEATIRMRKIGDGEIRDYRVSGEKPSFVDIPVYYTHAITNTGSSLLITLFWTNEIFNPSDPDTVPEDLSANLYETVLTMDGKQVTNGE